MKNLPRSLLPLLEERLFEGRVLVVYGGPAGREDHPRSGVDATVRRPQNFVIVERIKSLENARSAFGAWFWRTHQQQEIDYLEERDGKLLAVEIKRQARKARVPRTFTEAYPEAETTVVTPATLQQFLAR